MSQSQGGIGRPRTHVGGVPMPDGDAHAVNDVLIGSRQVHRHVEQRMRIVKPLRHLCARQQPCHAATNDRDNTAVFSF